jgi:hypothetical protein
LWAVNQWPAFDFIENQQIPAGIEVFEGLAASLRNAKATLHVRRQMQDHYSGWLEGLAVA